MDLAENICKVGESAFLDLMKLYHPGIKSCKMTHWLLILFHMCELLIPCSLDVGSSTSNSMFPAG